MPLPVKIARPPRGSDPEDWKDWAEEVERVINLLLAGAVVSVPGTYTVVNVTEDRVYDANATTINELADIVGTLISDLQDAGVVQ